MDRAGVAGPVFISVAPRETAAEKMNKFLDINPMVPRERLFVDDSPTFAAYASAGFKNIGEDQKTSLADATKLTAPRLSAGAWWRYLTNVASLSPVPDGLKFGEVPEGVLRCVLNRRVELHAIDATPARWRGDVGSSPLDGASAATASPMHPTHWLISTQVLRLGGTFVVDDDTVRFAHADKFPGDHPAIADVLRAAGISLVDAEGVAV